MTTDSQNKNEAKPSYFDHFWAYLTIGGNEKMQVKNGAILAEELQKRGICKSIRRAASRLEAPLPALTPSAGAVIIENEKGEEGNADQKSPQQ